MAYTGQSPENPVCVASAIVFDPTESQILVGARLETRNEHRHLRTVSTFTRTIPHRVFNELAGGDPIRWEIGAEETLPEPTDGFSIGMGEHGSNIHTFVVESVLGKIGLAGALAEGAVTGRGHAVLRSLTRVEDKDTETSEWTAMLHYAIVLDPDSDLSKIPQRSASYDPIVWVAGDTVPLAFAKRDAALLSPALEPLFFCLTGACMSGAARVLASRKRSNQV